MGETPTVKTLDETEQSSQPSTPVPAPPPWNEGSPQGFSHRFSRTRKVTARRNITPTPSYILDMMRTDPHVEFNTIDLTCDDNTSVKMHTEQLVNDYSTLSTNGIPAGESYPTLNSPDCFRKLSSTPGIESFDGLGITIDRSEYVPTGNLSPAVIHQRPAHDILQTSGTSLKPGANWLHTGLDPSSLSQNEMLAMMLQTSEPVPRVWGRGDNVEPNKTLNYPGVDLTKYGPLPQLEPIPPTFSEKQYQDSKLPPPYPYTVPPSDLIPAKDVKREIVPPMEMSDISSLESMQMRWCERMSSTSSECSTSIGSRNDDVINKCTSQTEQPNKRRRTGLQAPAIEPHLWTRKGLRPCAARLARSAEETMQLNSPVGDKDEASNSWKMEALSSHEPPSPQYSDISDAPSIPVSAKTSQHSRSSSVSPHGSSMVLAENAVENSKSPKTSTAKVSSGRSFSSTHSLKHCAVRVPRCSSQLSVYLSSSASSSTSEKLKQFEVDAPSMDTSPTLKVSNNESLGDDAPFKCSSCLLHFWKEDLFREHACLGRPWHQCPLCLSRFLSVPNLQRHMATKHSDESDNTDTVVLHGEQDSTKASNKSSEVALFGGGLSGKDADGMSEGDIHEWLFSVWEYNKDKPIPPDGIKCLFCDKVCFQVLSMKAHLLGVHKINLFNRQFQSSRNSQILQQVKSKGICNTKLIHLDPKAKNKLVNKEAGRESLSDSNFCLPSSSAAKAKSGAELKQKLASLLRQEIEKSKHKMIKTQTHVVEKQLGSSEFHLLSSASNKPVRQDSVKLNSEAKQAPNGIVKKTVGLIKGNKKVRFQYVRSLCQTLLDKNVSVVQLKNWLLEITTHQFEKYECILCQKVFNSLKSMQCHCLSVHRIPPGISNFKPLWRGMRALKAGLLPQVQQDKNESIVKKPSPLPSADVKFNITPELKHNLTNCLTKNLRKLLVKSHLVESKDCEDDVEADVRDIVQYAVHSVSEEAMVASVKQFHPPVIMGIVKEGEDTAIASKLDKEPPSDEDIDKWLASLKTAANSEQGDHRLECLMCSETYRDVEGMATHVSHVHRLTGLPMPSSLSQPNRTVQDVNTQAEAADGPDQLSSPLLTVVDLTDLRMYIKILLTRLYSEETLIAFGFPECSTDELLMRVLDHAGFSYCWFAEESEELLCNALCRNLKTLLAVSLPPEIKAYVHLYSNPVPIVLKALLDYTANEETSECLV